MRLFSLFLLLVSASLPAFARPIIVVDSSGQPVANAVVSFDTGGAAPSSYGQPLALSQQDIRFKPYVLAVPTGADVTFPNLDRVRHHVYSFSRGNRFELELYGREEQRFVTFDTPGTVAIGCNIHDLMLAYIHVTGAAYAGVTDADGRVEIEGLPADAGIAQVWQPDMSGGQTVDVTPVLDGEMMKLTLPARYSPPPPGAAE